MQHHPLFLLTNNSKLRRAIFILLGTPEVGWVRITRLKGRVILHGGEAEENPQCWAADGTEQLGCSDAQHGRPGSHWGLLTPSLVWDGAPHLPHTASSSRPHSRPHSKSSGVASSLCEIWGCLRTPVPSWAEPWVCPGSGVLPQTLLTPNPPRRFPAQPHLPGSLPAPKPISSSSETLLPPM